MGSDKAQKAQAIYSRKVNIKGKSILKNVGLKGRKISKVFMRPRLNGLCQISNLLNVILIKPLYSIRPML